MAGFTQRIILIQYESQGEEAICTHHMHPSSSMEAYISNLRSGKLHKKVLLQSLDMRKISEEREEALLRCQII